eukprot:11624168-Prorocentrum_lima.AAC.1
MNERMDTFMREMLEQNGQRRGGSHPDPAIPLPNTPNVQAASGIAASASSNMAGADPYGPPLDCERHCRE